MLSIEEEKKIEQTTTASTKLLLSQTTRYDALET